MSLGTRQLVTKRTREWARPAVVGASAVVRGVVRQQQQPSGRSRAETWARLSSAAGWDGNESNSSRGSAFGRRRSTPTSSSGNSNDDDDNDRDAEKLPFWRRRLNGLKSDSSSSSSSSSWRDNNEDAPSPSSTSSRLVRNAGLIGTGLFFLTSKTKFVLAALKLTKFSSVASMLASVGVYAMLYGWPYAVGFVSLLAIHESGHAAMMRRLGIPFSPMTFIPFVGAVVAMERHPTDAYDEGLVALAGPVVGGAAAVAVGAAGVLTNSQLLVLLGDVGIMMNLFNLLPIGFLDGGRIAGALSKWTLVGGLATGVGLAYSGAIQNPLFYVILVMAGFTTFERFTGEPPHPRYFRISSGQKLKLGAAYVGLIMALLAAQATLSRYRKSPAQIRAERERAGLLGRERSETERYLAEFARDMGKGDSFLESGGGLQFGSEQSDPWFRGSSSSSSSSSSSGGGKWY